MASKEWSARIENEAAAAVRTEPGLTETTPLIDDDTFTAARERLVEAVPAHLHDRVYAYTSEAVRAYTAGMLRKIGNAATLLGHRLELREYGGERKLRAAAEAQDLDALATRVYSRGAAYVTSASTSGYDTARRVAAEGVKYALTAYAKNSHTNEFQGYVEDGLIAESVLGTMPTFQLRNALEKGAFKVTHFGGIHQNTAVTLDPMQDGTPFSPPVLIGWAYPAVEEKNGHVQAVARATLFAILPYREHTGLLREQGDERAVRLLNTGAFKIENDEFGRVFGYPAMVLRMTYGSGYMSTPTYMRIVPLGSFVVKHVTRDEVGAQAMNDYAEMLMRVGYRTSYGAKKDATGPSIGKGKDGYVKWLSPDPFARK